MLLIVIGQPCGLYSTKLVHQIEAAAGPMPISRAVPISGKAVFNRGDPYP